MKFGKNSIDTFQCFVKTAQKYMFYPTARPAHTSVRNAKKKR